VAPGLETVRGQVPGGEDTDAAMYGVVAGFGGYDAVPVKLDFSPQAHDSRMAQLGSLSSRATYYLAACYD
jgi:hypothetical protein